MLPINCRSSVVATAMLVAAALPASALEFRAESIEGLDFILVSGEFGQRGDIDRFRAIIQSSSAGVVVFDSPGGGVLAALDIGRAIRFARLNTLQVRSLECSSACAFAFLGGVSRTAVPGSIGVHKASFDSGLTISPEDAVATVQEITAEIMGYVAEMGADPSLLQLSMSYDADDIRYLSKSEMEQYRVVTELAVADLPDQVRTRQEPRASNPDDIPTAQSGRVRHPKGGVALKSFADDEAPDLAVVRNGTPLAIVTNDGRWYGVRVEGRSGYLHHSWVSVDQFESAPSFDSRFIQIKSFSQYSDAESFVRSSTLPLAAHLATNGWFAITLDGNLDAPTAISLLRNLKAGGQVPDDSYVTYGNSYVRRVCCQ